MKHLLPLALLLLVISCGKEPKTAPEATPTAADSIGPKRGTPGYSYIKDPQLYDSVFLAEIGQWQSRKELADSVWLVGNHLMSRKDIVYLPENLVLNKKYLFEGANKTHQIKLSVVRRSYTLLEYRYEILADGKMIEGWENTATFDLSYGLSKGSHTVKDTTTGKETLFYNYRDSNGFNTPCSLYIYISEPDNNGRLKALIDTSCTEAENYDIIMPPVTLYQKMP